VVGLIPGPTLFLSSLKNNKSFTKGHILETIPESLELLTAKQAAELVCGVSRSKFYRMDSEGLTPSPIRFGTSCRWRRRELVEWVALGCPNRENWITIKGTQNV